MEAFDQLSFAGLDDRQADAARPPRVSRSTDAPVARARSRRRSRSARTLTPVEQMELLLRNGHLLRPKEREWVGKIGRTVRSRGAAADLSDRQRTVICDIFDRLRSRITR